MLRYTAQRDELNALTQKLAALPASLEAVHSAQQTKQAALVQKQTGTAPLHFTCIYIHTYMDTALAMELSASPWFDVVLQSWRRSATPLVRSCRRRCSRCSSTPNVWEWPSQRIVRPVFSSVCCVCGVVLMGGVCVCVCRDRPRPEFCVHSHRPGAAAAQVRAAPRL